ncbi:MAG: hypothetical protein K0S08_892 [Gammaproteobacteria bacterium]|jgi:hypothetical protein|nr:hypothetical protein [Gammaproteobacteria bacterium]
MERKIPASSTASFPLFEMVSLWKRIYSRTYSIFLLEANQLKSRLFLILFLAIVSVLLISVAWIFLCLNFSFLLYQKGLSIGVIFLLLAAIHLFLSASLFLLLKFKSQNFFPVTQQALRVVMENSAQAQGGKAG